MEDNSQSPLPGFCVFALAAAVPHESFAREGEGDAESAPLAVELAYTADAWTLASGGGEEDLRYLDNLDLALEADLEQLIGAPNTRLFVYGLYNNGEQFTGEMVGDALTVSNIEAPVEAARLYEAWIEHRFGGGPLSARVGLYDLNSEFDALEASSFFIGSAHGIGMDIAQSGETGPSIFPLTSLALRLEYEASENLKFRAAILDGVPGDPDNLKKTTVKLSEDDGALLIGEADYSAGPFRAIAGYWRYTSPFERHDGAGESDSYGAYLRGESVLFEREEAPGRLAGFFRAGWASGAVNDFSSFYSAGLVYEGLFAPSGGDQLGFAAAYAGASDDYGAANPATAGHETVFEFSYRAPLTDWFALQPNIQYVVNPGLDASASDALALGLRAEIGWARDFLRP